MGAHPRQTVVHRAGEEHYKATEHGLLWLKRTRDDSFRPVRLTNFRCQIVTDIREDDGVETRHQFELEAQLDGREFRFTVPAERFMAMTWVVEHLGAGAIVHPGMFIPDHARAAIQQLSHPIAERVEYTHLGWRQIDDTWVYLHGAGGIGPEGTVSTVEVRLPGPLSSFELPAPPSGRDLRQAVRASLRLLNCAPLTVTMPLLAAIYRAALASADFSVHLSGPTGTGKSELAALAQQHYGAGMDARHLPGSWSSTGNALEGLAFAAKDTLLAVDDFAPQGSHQDVSRGHREADRVFRAQGNRSGRMRMRADGSLQFPKPPRGLILATGEDVPRGQSLRARLLVIEVPKEAVKWKAVTDAQQAAAAEQYAAAMAGFVRWVAARYDYVLDALHRQVLRVREQVYTEQQHRRCGEIIANLAFGLRVFVRYAEDVGALSHGQADALFKRGLVALLQVAATQATHQRASDPVERFLGLVRAAIASGRAHIASTSGHAPSEKSDAWGWHWRGSGFSSSEVSSGERVGWVDGEDLYLEPEASYAAAQRMARDMGDAISVSPQTLRRRLRDRGILRSVEPNRQELTVRLTLEGMRRRVLHLHVEDLGFSPEQRPDPPKRIEEVQ